MSQLSAKKWVDSRIAYVEQHYPNPPEEKLEIIGSYRMIASLLNGQTSAKEAATNIASTFKPRMNTHHSTNFKSIWGILATASRVFSGVENERLVDLYLAIKALPDVTNKHGHVSKAAGGVVWKDMPDWGWIYWEHGLDLDWRYDPHTDPESEKEKWFEQAEGKLNSTTFAAGILAREGVESGMWRHASTAMTEALEIPYDTKPTKFVRDGVEVMGDPERELEGEWRMYVPPAVEWILVAGERIFEFSMREIVDERMRIKSEGWKWGGRYFSKERWELWMKRFRELSAWEEVDDRCRGLMEKAVGKMEEIESESGYVDVEATSLEGKVVFLEA